MDEGDRPMTSHPEPPNLHLHVRDTGASSVIVHRVRQGQADRFLELQRGITEVAQTYPGYQTTEVYPPAGPNPDEWVVLIHFDSPEALQRWLDAPVRGEWLAKMRAEVGEFRLRAMPAGFNAWFAGLVDGADVSPPSWKVAASILFTLYPTVMLLTIFVGPYLNTLGLALSMLVGNALSVAILQWAVTPLLNPFLASWLNANEDRQRAFSLGGLLLILILLGGMAIGFRLMVG
jgi:antibiotic biosynthesis monooxygenase (ABM) superfamily enzyme